MIGKCEYGCEQKANFTMSSGKRCCSSFYTKCPEVRKKNSTNNKGINNGMHGRKHSSYTIIKLKKARTTTGFRYSLQDYFDKHSLFTKIEELRENPDNLKEIQVKCKLCNIWFTPTPIKMSERIKQIEKDYGNDGCFFYCGDECKNKCNEFNLKIPKDVTKISPLEYNTWREEVLKRADYKCEYCDEKANTAHHSRPKKLEPFFELDPYYGIACCTKCHYKYGHKDECSTSNLAHRVCV